MHCCTVRTTEQWKFSITPEWLLRAGTELIFSRGFATLTEVIIIHILPRRKREIKEAWRGEWKPRRENGLQQTLGPVSLLPEALSVLSILPQPRRHHGLPPRLLPPPEVPERPRVRPASVTRSHLLPKLALGKTHTWLISQVPGSRTRLIRKFLKWKLYFKCLYDLTWNWAKLLKWVKLLNQWGLTPHHTNQDTCVTPVMLDAWGIL